MIQNTILSISQNTQERIAQESLLPQIYLFRVSYKTEAKHNFVWVTTLRHFHDIFTIFSRYSACIISVICVKSRDLRSVIKIFSRYFHDIFMMIESRHLHHFIHLCQESWFAQRNNDIFTTEDMYFHDIFTIFSRLTIFSGYFHDIFAMIESRHLHHFSLLRQKSWVVKISWKYLAKIVNTWHTQNFRKHSK